MWEEDPKWQDASFRLLVRSLIVALSLGFVVALWTGEWQPLLAVLGMLGIVLVALCVYAAIVWTVGHSVQALWRVIKPSNRKRDGA